MALVRIIFVLPTVWLLLSSCSGTAGSQSADKGSMSLSTRQLYEQSFGLAGSAKSIWFAKVSSLSAAQWGARSTALAKRRFSLNGQALTLSSDNEIERLNFTSLGELFNAVGLEPQSVSYAQFQELVGARESVGLSLTDDSLLNSTRLNKWASTPIDPQTPNRVYFRQGKNTYSICIEGGQLSGTKTSMRYASGSNMSISSMPNQLMKIFDPRDGTVVEPLDANDISQIRQVVDQNRCNRTDMDLLKSVALKTVLLSTPNPTLTVDSTPSWED